jgi:hypothetical protein
MNKVAKYLYLLGLIGIISLSANISSAQYRPKLFFREDWKENPAATGVTQDHVANPDLILGVYGSGKDSIRKSHHSSPADDPYYIWSGYCIGGSWAITLKHKNYFADLTGYAKVRWRSEQSGLRILHIILKLADGTWLVSDQGTSASKDWKISEFNLADIKWYALDIMALHEERPVANPDLAKVDEIGFSDLMVGGGSNACSRLDWIEVDGKPVKR